MVKKYMFGSPVETDAVIENIETDSDDIGYFNIENTDYDGEKNCIKFSYKMSEKDIVYGLGEANRGINKRGYRYESYCTDDPVHTEEKVSLYGAHNFILVDGVNRFGVFVDNPGKVLFDIGYEKKDELSIVAKYPDMYVYIIEGDTLKGIVREFRRIIGKSYMAPLWALGYQQSRWSYENEAAIMEVVEGYEKNDIPLSAVYMDIDYMESYKDFTVDKDRFPDLKGLSDKLKEKGVHLVPIIDAGVKIEKGYEVYEEGVKNDYFVKDKDGNDFVTAVWPGHTHFPDFLNSKVREWFGEKYKTLIDMGIDGFWNDMNEPATFYTKQGADKVRNEIKNLDLNNISDDDLMKIKYMLIELPNNKEDYSSMYHRMSDNEGNEKQINHERVHNLYGYNMTRAASEAFEKMEKKDILLFSRASYIGMHRYGGIWMGDNQSWWSHILLNLKMLPSLNMCGFLYTGADLGGFGSDCTRELLLRWLALGVFTPLMRNHSAMGTRLQECFRFEDVEDFRDIIRTRYRLIPYIYESYKKAVDNDDMMFRPLRFDYENDEFVRDIEDQLMVGDDIMIAPVYTPNSKGRYVYLPEDMIFIKFGKRDSVASLKLHKGHSYINVAPNEVPIFLKPGHTIPLFDIYNMNLAELEKTPIIRMG